MFEAGCNKTWLSTKLFSKSDPATSSIPGSVWMLSGNGLMQISWLTRDDGLVGLQDSVETDELSHTLRETHPTISTSLLFDQNLL